MSKPSTEWNEDIEADEHEKFSEYAKLFVDLQKTKSEKFGKGRALHRKQILAMIGELEVLSDIPDFAKYGLFAKPGRHEAWIRLSSGSMGIQPDSQGDIRGFAIKVHGVSGDSALENGKTSFQNFLLINQETFSSPKADQFVALVRALSQGGSALFKHLFQSYGLLGGIGKLVRAIKTFNKEFTGFATENFYSAAPLACGPYAIRVRLLPPSDQKPDKSAKQDWSGDMKNRLNKSNLIYDFQIQFFQDEKRTPIEDASVNWEESDAPYISVARLTIPKQDFSGFESKSFQDQVEKAIFDPWQALKEHKPLGNVMRARKYVYFASQKERGAAN